MDTLEERSNWTQLKHTAENIHNEFKIIAQNPRQYSCFSQLTRGPIITTGIGLAGGPARILAAQVARLGHSARYVPLTEFLTHPPKAATLIIFSQSLSPNIRLASRAQAAHLILFTAVSPTRAAQYFDHKTELIHVPSTEQHTSMIRLQSPVVSLYIALEWLTKAFDNIPWSSDLQEVPEATRVAFQQGKQLSYLAPLLSKTPVVFVCHGVLPEELHLLAWKWAEMWFEGPPLIVEALELAHGPLQAKYTTSTLFIGLKNSHDTLDVWDRVKKALHPTLHQLCLISAQLPFPLSLFEYDASLNALLIEALKTAPSKVSYWPTEGLDTPLYEFEG